ncbi:NepR family anti-sigma factor [Pseudogemmobacter sonorensis]|uniref:NepR family anti-sigma factor n=1 Tax=Pseudogemmobacter sonorensis TaxID=2989681 RepID=UPI003675EE04
MTAPDKHAPAHAQARINGQSRPGARSAIKAQIDENLRRAYEEVLTEEVPDRFKDLLAQLRAKDIGAKDPDR